MKADRPLGVLSRVAMRQALAGGRQAHRGRRALALLDALRVRAAKDQAIGAAVLETIRAVRLLWRPVSAYRRSHTGLSRRRRSKVSDEQIIHALSKTNGAIGAAAKLLQRNRKTISRRARLLADGTSNGNVPSVALGSTTRSQKLSRNRRAHGQRNAS